VLGGGAVRTLRPKVSAAPAGRGGAAQVPCGSQVAQRGGGGEGREP
jgi:hypothetical protein